MARGGTLPRKELHEAAEEVTAGQAGLIAVGEPSIEKELDKAFTGAARVVKRAVEATTDEITSELQEALKEADMVDMHLEVDIIPVSDVDRAKQFYQRLVEARLAAGAEQFGALGIGQGQR